jgi:hypothetical protein
MIFLKNEPLNRVEVFHEIPSAQVSQGNPRKEMMIGIAADG